MCFRQTALQITWNCLRFEFSFLLGYFEKQPHISPHLYLVKIKSLDMNKVVFPSGHIFATSKPLHHALGNKITGRNQPFKGHAIYMHFSITRYPMLVQKLNYLCCSFVKYAQYEDFAMHLCLKPRGLVSGIVSPVCSTSRRINNISALL